MVVVVVVVVVVLRGGVWNSYRPVSFNLTRILRHPVKIFAGSLRIFKDLQKPTPIFKDLQRSYKDPKGQGSLKVLTDFMRIFSRSYADPGRDPCKDLFQDP